MSFKDKLVESWKLKHLAEAHADAAADEKEHESEEKEDEADDKKLIKKMVKADALKKEDIGGLTESQVDQVILEVLSKDADAGTWIHDFVHSKNPKFIGKSKAKRRQMALAAYYGKKNEEVEVQEAVEDDRPRTKDTVAGRKPTNQKDDVGPTSDGKSTKVELKAEESVAESIGIKNVIKKAGSKLLKKLGHGSDEDMKKDLQRKMGIPQTGKPSMAKQNEETVEEGWDDMLADVKAKRGPQPNGGSGVKKGKSYGNQKPEKEDESSEKKK